ncbi:MAG: hypothetical protein EOM21_20865, partial [Gammaproteobacteria bacterium]|nr:hypothetical protein [Gammaproteobacteria bacterium]
MTLQISTLTEFENACIDVLNANITHIAIGTGTSTPIISQTTLDTETYREAIFESSSTSNTFTTSIFLDVTEAIGDTITEIGAFNSNSGG